MSHHAGYILGKAKQKDVAAFIIGGKLKTMFPSGGRFDLMMQDYSHRLVGVYGADATEQMIQDDLDALT